MNTRHDRIHKLILLALFTAITYIFSILPAIKVDFLSLDIKDAFITIGALYLGPLAGVLISAVVSVLETVSGSLTGFYGMIMNFIGSAAFSAVCALIYKYRKTLLGAVFALICSTIGMTAVMIASNLIITPYYTGWPVQAIKDLIIPMFLPFNIVKGILNSALVMLLYKPISTALRKAHLLNGVNVEGRMNKNTIIVAATSVVIIVASFLYIFFALNGSIQV